MSETLGDALDVVGGRVANDVVRVDEIVQDLLRVQAGDETPGSVVPGVHAEVTGRRQVVHDRWHDVGQRLGEMGDERLVALREDRDRASQQVPDPAGPATGSVDDDVALEDAAGRREAVPVARSGFG